MPIAVATPSRLHFGLVRFEQTEGPSYGGLGMMIEHPRWQLELGPADVWSIEGQQSERALEFAQRVLQRIKAPGKPPALRIHVHEAIPAHRGFGGGTQLGLAVASGVRRLLNLPGADAAELAALAGRGKRSAVGAHGFLHGGLIWERGRQPGEPLGQLAEHIALPQEWRVVLIDTCHDGGLSGQTELDAFAQLPPVPDRITRALIDLAEQTILPAAERGDLAAFGEGVYHYGRSAGDCFAPVQRGPYASRPIAECVEFVRRQGVPAVGQSSWGPTVFAITQDQQQAEQLCEALASHPSMHAHSARITLPANHGATLKHLAPGQ
ncbi:MAG TPA: hypothetical protein VF175_10730 [Lacipirellula sp.]